MDIANKILGAFGLAAMAWGMWGFPAELNATFALGLGMVLRPAADGWIALFRYAGDI